MQPLLIILIVFLLFLAICLFAFAISRFVNLPKNIYEKDWEEYAKQNINKYWSDPCWKREIFDNLCCQSFNHIKPESMGYFENFFTEYEITERKYETRPFVCLKKFKYKGDRYGLFAPLKSNHNATGIVYDTNFYVSQNDGYLDLKEAIFCPLKVFFMNKNWRPRGTVEEDINKWHKELTWKLKKINFNIFFVKSFDDIALDSFSECFNW